MKVGLLSKLKLLTSRTLTSPRFMFFHFQRSRLANIAGDRGFEPAASKNLPISVVVVVLPLVPVTAIIGWLLKLVANSNSLMIGIRCLMAA